MGVWGRGTPTTTYCAARTSGLVRYANDNRTKEGWAVFPKAKTYWDWRKCLEQKDIEAVVICTADHQHVFIANLAINRGLNVDCEKLLDITVEKYARCARIISRTK